MHAIVKRMKHLKRWCQHALDPMNRHRHRVAARVDIDSQIRIVSYGREDLSGLSGGSEVDSSQIFGCQRNLPGRGSV